VAAHADACADRDLAGMYSILSRLKSYTVAPNFEQDSDGKRHTFFMCID